jgi:hypothetical protein
MLPAAVSFISVAAAIMFYSYCQVRAGKWRHVDASIPEERRSLNPVLASIFGLAALLVNQIPGAGGLSLGFLFGGLIPAIAILFSRWMKLSQHVAFAGFMATWLWTVAPWLSFAGFLIAALIAWSRIELRRHTCLDVCGGYIVGVGAGGGLLLLLRFIDP